MKTVIVSLTNGDHLTTSMDVSEEKIREYYKIGAIVITGDKETVRIKEVNVVEKRTERIPFKV